MPQPRKARKATEERIPKTLYLRRAVLKRAERMARREERSLSQYIDRAVVRALEIDEPAVAEPLRAAS